MLEGLIYLANQKRNKIISHIFLEQKRKIHGKIKAREVVLTPTRSSISAVPQLCNLIKTAIGRELNAYNVYDARANHAS